MKRSPLLHPLTGSPIVPVGYVNGRPVWPILGGSTAVTPTFQAPPDPAPPATGGDPDEPDSGGDAVDADGDDDGSTGGSDLPPEVKAALKKANDEAKKWRLKARELEPLAARARELEESEKSELQRAQEAAAANAQQVAALTARAAQAEAKVLAQELEFADPADAALYVDLAAYVDDAGDVDTDRLRGDLTAVLQAKPHLRRPDAAAGAGRFQGGADAGPRGNAGSGPTLDQQIADAERAGDMRMAISLKSRKLAALMKDGA